MSRPLLLLASLGLAACNGDTGFSAGKPDNEDLQGTGAYDLVPTGTELLWQDMVPGYTCSQFVRLDSVGEENLVIEKIDVTVSGGVFTMEEVEQVTVPIGDSFEFSIQALLPAATEATGELRILSNDVDTVDLRLPLRAVPLEGWEEGDTGEGDC